MAEGTSTKLPVAMGERGLELRTLEDAWRFATGLVQGGMVPKSLEKAGERAVGAVVGILQAGKELGLQPMFALSNVTFVNGRVGLMGDAARAVVKMRGGLRPGTDFRVEYAGDENTPEWTCTVSAHRAGMEEPSSASFSLGDAIRAGLVRLNEGRVQARGYNDWNNHGPWATYTKRMLMYRALGFLCRDTFGDLLAGATLVEELQDYPAAPERDVTPPKEPDPLLADSANTVAGGEQDTQIAGPDGGFSSPADPYSGEAWKAFNARKDVTVEELEAAAAELEARPSTRDKNKALILRRKIRGLVSQGAGGVASQQVEPEGSVTEPVGHPAGEGALSRPAAAPSSEPERDPETGEVIPDHVGRELAEPPRVEGFTHVADAVGAVMGDLDRTGKAEPDPIDADYQVEDEDGTGPFDARPEELELPDQPAPRVTREQRQRLRDLLAGRGKKEPQAALRFLSTIVERSVSSTETLTQAEYDQILRALGAGPDAQQGDLL